MAGILPTSGTRVSIGALSSDPATLVSFTAAGNNYKVIAGITNIGSFGDTNALITSEWIGEGRTKKAQGNANAGSLELACDYVPNDPGQLALAAAQAVKGARYNIKIETPAGGGLYETYYMPGIVMSGARNLGGANTVQSRAFTIELDDAPLVVAPA